MGFVLETKDAARVCAIVLG